MLYISATPSAAQAENVSDPTRFVPHSTTEHGTPAREMPHPHQPCIGEEPLCSLATPARHHSRAISRSISRSIERALNTEHATSPEPPGSLPVSPTTSPSPSANHGQVSGPLTALPPLAIPPVSHAPNSPPAQLSTAVPPGSPTSVAIPDATPPLAPTTRTRARKAAQLAGSAAARLPEVPNPKKRPHVDPPTVAPSAPKKARISKPLSSQPPIIVSVPEGAPPWLLNLITLLSDSSLGPRWMELVSSWLSFEEQEDYTVPAQSQLRAAGRPAAVGDWIRRARVPTFRPKIANVKAYEKAHVKWWASVQPEWRQGANEGILAGTDGDWSDLRKSGANGILSVIVSLFFWGTAGSVSKRKGSWGSSVEELISVLEHLLRG